MLAEAVTIEDVRQAALSFNPLRAARIPDWITCEMAWVKTSYGYALSIAGGHVGVIENLLGQAHIQIKLPHQPVQHLDLHDNAQAAIAAAESIVANQFPDQLMFLDRGASWRNSKDPPSEKQVALCQRLHIRLPPNATKGQVSDLIGQRLAEKR